MTSEVVQKLLQEIEELQRKLDEAQGRLQEERNRAAGIAVGDIVLDRLGVRYKVSAIEHWGHGNIKLDGHKELKTGGWHKDRHYIGTTWTKPK